MRVLILVARDVIDESRVIAQAQTVRAMGHEPLVVCWDRKGRYPLQDEIHGVPVRRLRTTGLMRWLPNDTARNPVWWVRAAGLGARLRPDLVVCQDLDTLVAGVRLQRRLGIPVVYDSCELFYYMIADKVPRLVSRGARALERRLLRWVDHVLVVDDPYVEYFRKEARYRGPITKVMNTVRRAPAWDFEPPEPGPFTVFYAGSLTPDRLVLPICELPRRFPEVRVVVAGSGVLEADVRRRAAEIPNLTFLGTVPFDEIVPLMRRHHAVPALTDPSNVNVRLATSLKQFEAMTAGRPVIAARGTLTGTVAEETASGVTVEFSTHGLWDAVERLLREPGLSERLGRNALRAAKSTYNWDHEEPKFRAVLALLLESARARVGAPPRTLASHTEPPSGVRGG